jgi:hypothetical protein
LLGCFDRILMLKLDEKSKVRFEIMSQDFRNIFDVNEAAFFEPDRTISFSITVFPRKQLPEV